MSLCLLSEERKEERKKSYFHDKDIDNLKDCDYMLIIVQQDDNWVD